MHSFTNKYFQTLLVIASFLLLLSMTACNKETPTADTAEKPAPTPGETAAPEIPDLQKPDPAVNNEENANADEENGGPDDLVKQADDSKTLEKPSNDYNEISAQGFLAPTVEGKAVEYLSAQVNEEKTAVFYAYKDAAFKSQYEKDLKKAGFSRKADNIYVKKQKKDPALIVNFIEKEDRFYIGMYTTADPFGLYKNLPDARQLYPLEDGVLAAPYSSYTVYDFAQFGKFDYRSFPTSQQKAKRDMYYTYKQIPKSIVDDYSKRLKKDGYVNCRIPQSPKFCKTFSDKIEDCVTYKLSDYDADTKLWDMIEFEMTARQLQ